jgi:hypothetical protein
MKFERFASFEAILEFTSVRDLDPSICVNTSPTQATEPNLKAAGFLTHGLSDIFIFVLELRLKISFSDPPPSAARPAAADAIMISVFTF